MVAQGDAENIMQGSFTSRDKQSLIALKALIESKLSAIADGNSRLSKNELLVNSKDGTQVAKREEQEDVKMSL